MGICTSSGGAGVWMADACVRAGLEVPQLDAATRAQIDELIPSYGTSQNPVDSTAQGVHKLGYAAFARLAAQSPLIDGVMVVVTARRSAFLADDQPKLMALAKETTKPVFMWTYTLPSDKSVEIVNEAGYPLFKNADSCARVMRAMADYRGTARTPAAAAKAAIAGESRIERRRRRCSLRRRPCFANGRRGRCSRPMALPAANRARSPARPPRPKRRRENSRRRSRSRCNPPTSRTRPKPARRAQSSPPMQRPPPTTALLANAKRHAPAGHHRRRAGAADGAAGPRGHSRRISRDATWGPLLMVGLGGVLVEALGDVALAPVPLDHAAARALDRPPEGRAKCSTPIAARRQPTSTRLSS